jgi:hypothetical protein
LIFVRLLPGCLSPGYHLSCDDPRESPRCSGSLEAVEGRDTSVEAILARHGEERLSPEEFDRHFGSLPTDAEG